MGRILNATCGGNGRLNQRTFAIYCSDESEDEISRVPTGCGCVSAPECCNKRVLV